MEQDPDDRYVSTGKLARALLPFAPPGARRAAERAAAIEPALRSRRRTSTRVWRAVGAPARLLRTPVSDRRTRRLAIAAGLALALGGFALISTLVRAGGRRTVVVTATPPQVVPAPAASPPPPAAVPPVLEQLASPPAPTAPPAPAPAEPKPAVGRRAPVDEVARPRTIRPKPEVLPAVRAPEARAEAPAEAPVPSLRQEVDPSGGREPLRPIEARNPYGAP